METEKFVGMAGGFQEKELKGKVFYLTEDAVKAEQQILKRANISGGYNRYIKEFALILLDLRYIYMSTTAP